VLADHRSDGRSRHYLLDEPVGTCSTSQSANVWRNATMESFFPSLKSERTARKVYWTREDAKAKVFEYVECFKNPRRRRSTLGYMSLAGYDQQAILA
jgi:putative transposase